MIDVIRVEPPRSRPIRRLPLRAQPPRSALDPAAAHRRARTPLAGKNPFFAHADVELLLAVRHGRVVGRVAAIDDRLHKTSHRDNIAAFGFFEAEDRERGEALLRRVEAWARQRGRALCAGR